MKDLPHHMKKLNRRIIRSMRREDTGEELPAIPTWPDSEREAKKKAKIQMREKTLARPSSQPTPDERNKVMKKGRVPVFDRTNNAKPKHAAPSKKKTPKL